PDATDPLQILYPLGVVALFVVLWLLRARTRAPLAGMLFYAGTLFPALGFVNVYPFRYSFVADHFQYLASIGVIALAAAGASIMIDRWRVRWMEAALIAAVTVPLVFLTWQQSHDYVDAETLYEATLRRNPAATMADINLGILYLAQPTPRLEDARQ